MTDIALTWNNASSEADWSITNGSIDQDSDLSTAIILSLFTDRVDPGYQNQGIPDHRGWWGDAYDPTGPTGSRLWQLQRTKIVDRSQTLLRVNDFVKEALQWLIVSGAVARFAVSSRFSTLAAIEINITAYEPSNGKTSFSYAWAWNTI